MLQKKITAMSMFLVIENLWKGLSVMEKRNEINDRVVQWILNKVTSEFADDVSLVLIYGSYMNGTANRKSDVDCYYIPKTEHGYDMAVDFMIEGVGYDIFPIPWERVEKIADLLENMSPLVGDVKIIYHNSTSDIERFQMMQERLKRNLSNDTYVRKIAARRCEEAGRLCVMLDQNRRASEIRKIAGNMIMTLADAVAVYHHDYYHFGLKRQYEDLKNNFPDVPRTIIDGYRNVVEAIELEDVKKNALRLFDDVCGYLDVTFSLPEVFENKNTTVNKLDAAWLASLYEEISSTFQKIYMCCESGNHILAFLSAVCLQRELDDAKEAGSPVYDLLGDFNYKELSSLAETTHKIENDLVQLITDNNGFIKKYDSFEQFESAKL